MSKQILVIGGGAAGMMAAICAAEQGGSVTLLEPNERLGKKLNITGKGRWKVSVQRLFPVRRPGRQGLF